MIAPTHRYSRQREAIRRLLRSDRLHLTAEEIHRLIQDRFPRLSLGTVYRNLQILQEVGDVRELAFDGGPRHYEAVSDPHVHLICRVCRRIEDQPIPEDLSADRLQLRGEWNLEMDGLEFYGCCEACQLRQRE